MNNKTKINGAEDVLAWDLFLNGSKKRNKTLPKSSTLDNRLIFETKNLFVVAGLGCFVPGYFLIITKSAYSSFAQLNDDEFKEYSWLIEKLSKIIKLFTEKMQQFLNTACVLCRWIRSCTCACDAYSK